MSKNTIDELEEIYSQDENKALTLARSYRDYGKANKNIRLVADVDYFLASVYYENNDEELLERFGNNAIDGYSKLNDYTQIVRVYNLLGLGALRMGKRGFALKNLFEGLKIAEKYELYLLRGMIYLNCANIHMQLNDYGKALHFLLLGETNLLKCDEGEVSDNIKMVAYTEGALCARLSNNIPEFDNQYIQVKSILKNNSEERNNIDLLTLNVYLAIDKRDEALIEENIKSLYESLINEKDILDYYNELVMLLELLMNRKKYGLMERLFERIESEENIEELVGLMAIISDIKLRYYEKTNQRGKMLDEAKNYWRYSQKLISQNDEALTYLFDTQSSLMVSERTNEQLRHLADTDALTGLSNRRNMNEKADQFFEGCYHDESLFGIEMLDIDDFKHINDNYGHSTGDDALRLLANCLKKVCNKDIYAARYGGDEFVILFRKLNDDQIEGVSKRLKSLLEEGIKKNNLPKFTISQGVYTRIPKEINRVWDFMAGADAALYEAKNTGKNNVVLIHSTKELSTNTTNKINTFTVG